METCKECKNANICKYVGILDACNDVVQNLLKNKFCNIEIKLSMIPHCDNFDQKEIVVEEKKGVY